MRSYLDIIIDLKDGKEVSKQELGVALLFAHDQLFFANKDIDRLLEKKNLNPIVLRLMEDNRLSRFACRKAPMDKWFGANTPVIK